MQNDTALEEFNILIRLDTFAAHTSVSPLVFCEIHVALSVVPFQVSNPAVADRRPKVLVFAAPRAMSYSPHPIGLVAFFGTFGDGRVNVTALCLISR